MAGGDPHAVAAADLPRLRLPYVDGLITIDRVRRTPGSPVCPVPAGDPSAGHQVTRVEFVAADPGQAARTAVALVETADLTAVAVHARFAPVVSTALAVCFAGRLHDARTARGLASRVVVADHRPELAGAAAGTAVGAAASGSLVRLPHIVAVHHRPDGERGPQGGPKGSAGVTDRVVWEIMSAAQYRAWLGGLLGPAGDALERHLGGLLALAGLVRARWAQVPRHDEVLQALRGGPLTIGAVYRHPGLLLAVAAALGDREA
ncbi:hypothetical protein ACG83_40010 [Frankia sp. R43]|uniref:hypothetical protein n=1 Tax=Frankia sp. R43 TaxID=269536 RepID=UPI0006CA12B7|nr:hypothetical protein [Frankia sp. R43]KPM50495.1 hypothetical protein ACG83_40010 [Frankia sp. R43]